MADTRKIMIDWLKDAHAMERASVDNLERQIKHLYEFPDVRAKLEEQLRLTRSQQERIDSQLRSRGSDPSTIKDVITRIAGQAQALVAGTAPDEVVKQAASTYAYENWEVANFKALAACARHEGEPELGAMFQEMAREKEAMASWLAERIPAITERYLDMQKG